MKWIFAILLVINILFYTVMQLGSSHGREPMRGHEPVKADNIKLLVESQKAPEMALAMSESPEKSRDSVPVEAKPEICLEWGQFSGATLKRVAQALEKLQLGEKLIQHKAEKSGGYWVYITPRKTLQEAQKKVDELKQLGLQESYIVRDPSVMQYAISMGIFSTAEAAAKYLDQLREKGVKSAVSGPRTQEIDATVFQIKDSGEFMTAQLTKLKLDFPGSELKAVECRKTLKEGQ
ncbi:MAG: SPOR domain-containing protein [Gammaproteobacteria bacterium]|nr:SPOR domain-containing protein [Gammaproteobacteria bacterium]MBU1978875.1 SPOR domain-containing protein [Gammaproteobacteria bacterium]